MQLSPEQFIATHQVFSREEFAKLLVERNQKANNNTVNSHLYRWETQGRIIQIKRGVYANATNDLVLDPFLIASKLSADAIISNHSALELHGFAQSYLNEIQYLTLHSPKELIFQNVTYKPIKPRPSVKTKELHNKWVQVIDRKGEEISVTSLERTLVDVLDNTEIAGGIEEVWRSISSLPAFRYKELENYLVHLNRPVTNARVGFYLEQNQERLSVPKGLLDRLEKIRPQSKVYFRRKEKGDRKFINRWNLVVPEICLENDWEGLK